MGLFVNYKGSFVIINLEGINKTCTSFLPYKRVARTRLGYLWQLIHFSILILFFSILSLCSVEEPIDDMTLYLWLQPDNNLRSLARFSFFLEMKV